VAQARTGALLNPRIDSTFKALFTQPNEASRAAMHAFLEAATERRIATWEISQNEAPIEYVGHRGVSFDISCRFDDGMAAERCRLTAANTITGSARNNWWRASRPRA
jgi:hypothetical protein